MSELAKYFHQLLPKLSRLVIWYFLMLNIATKLAARITRLSKNVQILVRIFFVEVVPRFSQMMSHGSGGSSTKMVCPLNFSELCLKQFFIKLKYLSTILARFPSFHFSNTSSLSLMLLNVMKQTPVKSSLFLYFRC